MKMCGFLKRSLFFVKDANTIVSIYNTIVRSTTSYACLLWNPQHQYLINELERVQRNLVRYICYKTGLERDDFSYEELCKKFHIPTLSQFRQSISLVFFYNLIHGKIKCPELLNRISVFIPPVATRSGMLFGEPKVRTDYKRRMWHFTLPKYCNIHKLNPFMSFSQWKKAISDCI